MFLRTTKGFTLIELMVVVIILGILAGLIIPKIMGRPEEALGDYGRGLDLADESTACEASEELEAFAAKHADAPGLDSVRALFASAGQAEQ